MSTVPLPPRLARYAHYPWIPFLLFCVIAIGIAVGPKAPRVPETGNVWPTDAADSSDAAQTITPVIAMTGPDPLRIELQGSFFSITNGSLQGSIVVLDPPGTATLTPGDGAPALAAQERAGQRLAITRGDGSSSATAPVELLEEEDGFKITAGTGTVARVKLKLDEAKWNLYDPSGTRIARGKIDGTAVVVKDSQDNVKFRVEFAAPVQSDQMRLLLSAILALPLEAQERAVLIGLYLARLPA